MAKLFGISMPTVTHIMQRFQKHNMSLLTLKNSQSYEEFNGIFGVHKSSEICRDKKCATILKA